MKFPTLLLMIISLLLLQSNSANAFFFIFIPGSAIDALGDALTGATGDNCVRSNAKIGDRIKVPDGSIREVQKLSGTSPRCQTADFPIRALLGPPIQITDIPHGTQTKIRMDLPPGWASVTLTPEIKNRGFFFQALNTTIDAGLLLSYVARNRVNDIDEYANTRKIAQTVNLSDSISTDILRNQINGRRVWQFDVSGVLQSGRNSGKQITRQITIIEGKKEIVEISTWMYTAGFEAHRKELRDIAKSVKGL